MQRRGWFMGMAMVIALGFTGCSSDDADDPDGNGGNGGKGGNGGDSTQIHITFDGDAVSPNGKQIAVPVNEPIELHVTADEPGELHVHTTPEQAISYPAGDSTHELTLDRPGVYEVESHDLDKIVVELEAS